MALNQSQCGMCICRRMDASARRSLSRVLADGSACISASALIAALINVSPSLAGLWGSGFLHNPTNKVDEVIIVASLLLFPSTFIIYGVARVMFAAKEAVEKKAMEKGRKAERERIERELEALEKSGVKVPPEVSQITARESGLRP